MRDPSSIILAIGFQPGGPIDVAGIESFTHAAARLSSYYSSRSVCFWTDDAEPILARRQLIRAALYENSRQGIEYLLLVSNLDRMDIQTTDRLVEKIATMPEGGCVALSGTRSKPYALDIALISMRWACRMAECAEPTNWFAMSNGSGPDRTFLKYLKSLGCPVAEIAASCSDLPAVHAPQIYRLPRGVHFLPAVGGPSVSMPIGELSARIAAAFSAVASLPSDAKLAIYGAGTVGRALLPLLAAKAVLIIDRNPELQRNCLSGVPVAAPADLDKYQGGFTHILITVIGREPEIRSTLVQCLGTRANHISILDLEGRSSEGNPAPEITLPKETRHAPEIPKDLPQATSLAGGLPKTTERTITKRGVLYVGYPCNIRCRFCYYALTGAKEWHPIEECKRDASTYRHEYGNEWVDITGGEPTVYPHIFELLDHCGAIGLKPSLITNMQILRDEDKVRRFKDHRVYDFLCSIHGMGDVYNHITNTTQGWQNIIRATRNFERAGMRWRANCTMININMRQLKAIAKYAHDYGARVINFINYNPFYEWSNKLDIDFQARHSEIAPHLLEALDYCDSVGMEANVRYMPFCQIRGHEEKCYNYSQLSYDPHEWDYCSWFSDATRNPSSKMPRWMTILGAEEQELHFHLAQRTKETGFAKPAACHSCAMGIICDGPTTQYARRFGTSEFEPYVGPFITDPVHFVCNQRKVVDEI